MVCLTDKTHYNTIERERGKGRRERAHLIENKVLPFLLFEGSVVLDCYVVRSDTHMERIVLAPTLKTTNNKKQESKQNVNKMRGSKQ